MIFLRFVLCISLALGSTWFPFEAHAQRLGKPFIRNYKPQEYKASIQNWAVTQDERGVMYFGNNGGLLEFDGSQWNLHVLANGVRSILPHDGRIYVGTIGNFGYYVPDSSGKLKFHSLLDRLSEQDRDFVEVWRIHEVDDAVYFQSFQLLIRVKGDDIKVWHPEGSFHYSYKVGETLFIKEIGGALLSLQGDKLEPLSGTESLQDAFITGILQGKEEEELVFVTAQKGLFTAKRNGNSLAISPLPTAIDGVLKQMSVYHGVRLFSGRYALATLESGIYVVSPEGELLQHIGPHQGLQNETVYYLMEDQHHALWAALDNGMSRIETHSPFSLWDKTLGIEGIILDVIQHSDGFYVATNGGVFVKKGEDFVAVEGIEGQTWDLISYFDEEDSQHEPRLLVANAMGIYEIIKGRGYLLRPARHVFKLYKSKQQPKRVFAGLSEGLISLRYEDGTWQDEGRVTEINAEVRSIASDEEGSLWLGTLYQGVVRLRMPEASPHHASASVQWYDHRHGLPDGNFIQAYSDEGRVLFTTDRGIYTFNTQKGRFLPDTTWGQELAGGDVGVSLWARQSNKKYWLRTFDESNKWIELHSRDMNTSFARDSRPFKRLPEMDIFTIYPEPEQDITWIGGSEGLFRYEPFSEDVEKYRKEIPFHALIRKVVIGRNRVLLDGSFYETQQTEEDTVWKISNTQPEALYPEIESGENAIKFSFATTYYEKPSELLMRYKLEGYDEDWSDWNDATAASYTNLPAGDYHFLVEAKNVYGEKSETSRFSFKVLPPFHLSVWAFLVYGLLFLGFVWGVVKLNTLRLRREKMQLALLVRERTHKVHEQHKELEVKAKELEEANQQNLEKNKKITDSINYAWRIQNAILPPREDMAQYFEELFIFFRPKDIVSGDFYYFANVNGQQLVAAIDCTGHGVPGGFMSMIAYELLNEIILRGGITVPGEVFEELHLRIVRALKQDREFSRTRDGLDGVMLTLTPSASRFQVAGAHLPAYFLQQSGELEVINTDRLSVGGQNATRQAFSTKEKEYTPGDCVYLSSDGYQDQFGGPVGRKFMKRRLREMLQSFQGQKMAAQEKQVAQQFEAWKGKNPQVDDIVLLGLRLK